MQTIRVKYPYNYHMDNNQQQNNTKYKIAIHRADADNSLKKETHTRRLRKTRF